MAVAAAIGVGGLDDQDERPSSNLISHNRFSKNLKQKMTDSTTSMHKMVLDTSLKSSDIPMLSSGGVLGEINRSIEKMSLTMEDSISVPAPASKQDLERHRNDAVREGEVGGHEQVEGLNREDEHRRADESQIPGCHTSG